MVKAKMSKKSNNRLKGPKKGRIDKKAKKLNGKTNGHSKPIKDESFNDEDDSIVIKKKPSKAELKSVIEALKKEANLLMVRKALKYIPFYLKSEGLTKKLLKEIIRLWAESSEKVRVICLLCLIRIYTKLQDKEKRQHVIKKLYTTFLDKCRVTKNETMSMIGFMRHSLVELYKIDPQLAFKQSQTSCQQLSLTLKNATTHKNEDTYKTVLNWQYANCLILLSQLITSHDEDSPVKSLTQQVIQLNLESINLLTSPRYYPYYCHLIENLIHISISANVFIPILPLIISILKRIQIAKERKEEKTNHDDDTKEKKNYNIDLLNHVSLEESRSLSYNVAVFEKLYELLLLYLANQCNKIAFPELVFLPCVQLKKWLKQNPGNQAQKLKSLLDKIKADSDKVDELRKSVDFAFTNYSAVDAWEKKLKDQSKLQLPKLLTRQ